MKLQRRVSLWLSTLVLVACGDPQDPTSAAPSLRREHNDGHGQATVVVNPSGHGHGTVATIQAGIDLVPAGGRVRVMPGTYPERIVIDKGLTLEGVTGDDRDDDDEEGASVIIEQVLAAPAPLGGLEAVIQVVTTEPVVVRRIRVQPRGAPRLEQLYGNVRAGRSGSDSRPGGV